MVEPIDFNSGKPQRFPKQIDAKQVRAKLADNARSFVQYLYSGRARFSKNEARIGNVYGEKGESLSIHLTGETAGLWIDHANIGDQGDLIDLYMRFRGYTQGQFGHALAEICRDFLGDMSVTYSPAAGKPTPDEQIERNKTIHGTKPGKQHDDLGPPVESYLYFDHADQIVAIVRRYEFEERDPKSGKPKKTFRVHPKVPDVRPLYRSKFIKSAPHIVLCEGEKAANALAALGIDSTSAMGGASTKVMNVDWHLIVGRQVTIWPDRDAVGWRYAQEAAAVLTSLGCRVSMVTPPEGPQDGWDAADLIEAGGDPTELLQLAKPWEGETEQPQAGRFKLVNIDSLDLMRPLDWLIPGKLTKGGMSVLWGPPSCLKTFVSLDFGLPVAAGLPWHGFPVVQGPVVFIAAEGASGLLKRLRLWRLKRAADHSHIPFEILPQNVAIREELDELLAVLGKMPAPPVMIIIDTLARTFGAGDENKQADMNAFVSAIDRLREITGAHVMVIHHSGVIDGARERGSNVLRGAADTVIKVQRDGHKIKLINRGPSGKQKDAEEFPDVNMIAAPCAEMDPRTGEEIASLLLVLDETDEDKPEPEKPRGRPAELQDEVLAVLKAEFECDGEAVGASFIERALKRENAASRIKSACEGLVKKGLAVRTTTEAEPGRWRYVPGGDENQG
jgi:hypothetical protein